MRAKWRTWVAFAVALAAVLAAMGWVSVTAAKLEEAQLRAHRTAAVEENVRLALWRMESALAPIVAAESARPYFAYSAFYPAERAYTKMFAEIGRGEVLVPSELLNFSSPHVRVHFQYGPDGKLTSPQVPTGNMRDLAESRYTAPEQIDLAARRLADLGRAVKFESLAAAVPEEALPAWDWAEAPAAHPGHSARYSREAQQALSLNALQARQRSQIYNAEPSPRAVRQRPKVCLRLMRPVWLDGVLVLARRISVSGGSYVQGCVLDWQVLEGWLLAEVRDLLPEARLEPAEGPPGAEAGGATVRMLAAIPVRLVPGPIPPETGSGVTPIRAALVVAWVCVAVGAVAAAALLAGAMRLSERRGSFVSAVTHELRTPLTTFRMYTEMLDEGKVPDESKRRKYVATLRSEADRLGHLVENVLAYARLENGRSPAELEEITLGAVVERLSPRLAERARQAGMELVIGGAEEEISLTVRTDVSAVEQILFNLVDNACKYASSAEDRRIHMDAGRDGRRAVLRVSDHGAGVDDDVRRRLFSPFSRSAGDAAGSAPGVGLGLALSRRLARDLGGDLRLEGFPAPGAPGASFALVLPAV